MRATTSSCIVVMALAVASLRAQAPAPAQATATPPQTPRSTAPIDLTGTWVSVVTEDWRWRMLVPRRGDTASVPLNAAGMKAANAWDPSTMAADGCKPYGAAAIMRVPGRIRVSWVGETTIRIETDAGAQTRLLQFDGRATRPAVPTWQGRSVAQWERLVQPGGLGVSLAQAPPRMGTLKVVTTNLRAGYLRRNGVPYSDQATMTEYFDRFSIDGTDWLTVLTVVDDGQYLTQPFITSTHFRREADDRQWSPAPCE